MNCSRKLNAKTQQNKKIEYSGITKLIIKGNYRLALTYLKEYLEKYPGNNYAIYEYANILRCQGRLDEALCMLEQSKNNSEYILGQKGYCYYLKGEYEKAKKVLESIRRMNDDIEQVIEFCKIKLNDYSEEEMNKKRYSVQQLANYSEEKLLKHLNFHRTPKYGRSYFDKNINVEEVFHNIQKILKDSKPTWNKSLCPQYVYHINNIGYDEHGVRTNHLSVITLPNSYDILTMAPNGSRRNTEINDYETMLQKEKTIEPTKQKVMKRESQIDKFNRRYGK